jgi:hypothetical protein
LLHLKAQGVRLGFSTPLWTMAVTGGLVVLVSFVLDSARVLRQSVPPPFHWGVFTIGIGLALIAVVIGVSRLEHRSRSAQPEVVSSHGSS